MGSNVGNERVVHISEDENLPETLHKPSKQIMLFVLERTVLDISVIVLFSASYLCRLRVTAVD